MKLYTPKDPLSPLEPGALLWSAVVGVLLGVALAWVVL